MKSLSFPVTLLFALSFLSCNKEIDSRSAINAPVQSSNVVTRQDFEVTYDLGTDLYSICSPEIIRMSGTGYIKVKYMFRDNGYHSVITSRISNAKGVGVLSGKIYTVTARSHEVILRNLSGPQLIENYKERYVIKGEGEPTYIAVGSLSWKFDANGNETRLKAVFNVECK